MELGKPLHLCYYNVTLPTVYDDTITYIEQLNEMAKKVNEIIDYTTNILANANKYTDAQNAILKKEMLSEISKTKSELDTKIDSVNTSLNKKIESLDNKIDNVYTGLLVQIAKVRNDLTVLLDKMYNNLSNDIIIGDNLTYLKCKNEIEILQKQVDDIVINGIKMISPFTGRNQYLYDVIIQLYDSLRIFGITAYEYDKEELTAQEYDDLQLTAIDYDTKFKLLYTIPRKNLVFDPWTGEKIPLRQLVYKLVDLHKDNGITAENYDKFLLSASEYDSKSITAYEYDWDGLNKF